MRYQKFLLGVLAISLLAGCATVHGFTRKDKQGYILTMQESALEQLYELKPEARHEVENSKGYAVFSNIDSHLVFLSTGSGYGVTTDRITGEKTYMKMFSLGGGLGLGAKDYRGIIIFMDEKDLNQFVQGKWNFSGHIDAAAKSQEKGGSLTGAKVFNKDVIIYQITEAGLVIHVTLQGTRYYRYHELNYK